MPLLPRHSPSCQSDPLAVKRLSERSSLAASSPDGIMETNRYLKDIVIRKESDCLNNGPLRRIIRLIDI